MQADYIVIGAGSAGCAVAGRLSEGGKYSVLVLEAGPKDEKFWIKFAIGCAKLLTDPDVNWMMKSEPENAAGGRRVHVPAGRVLGGSSAINGGLYLRGSHSDYDGWAQRGCRGWSFADVLPYFKRMEDFSGGADEYRAVGGPLHVEIVRERDPLVGAFIEAAAAIGLPKNQDVNGAAQEGMWYGQGTTRHGWRDSAADAYLKPARNRSNLTIQTDALVKRILFTDGRATSVVFEMDGQEHVAAANREVILSAGGVHSPAILERSGIGDGERLSALGIPVIADNPSVGENLQDHWATWMKWRISGHRTINERSRGIGALGEGIKFAFARSGALALPLGSAVGFAKTRPGLEDCDVQLCLNPLSYGNPETRRLDSFPGITVSSIGMRPQSRGAVHIQSAEHRVSPRIHYNAFSQEQDIRTIAGGVGILRRMMAAAPMARFKLQEINPGPDVPDLDVAGETTLIDYIREKGNSCYHASGSCRMGDDPHAVVDSALRVNGVRGLRVADASIMPTIVSGNTNAAAIMIGEKASDLVLADC